MKNYQYIIFFTLLQPTLGVHIPIMKGRTITFPLPEHPLQTIHSIEWKYHTINKTILLATINLNKKHQPKIFSKRTGILIMENGTLHIEDIKDEDSGNYSCTVIFHNQRMQIEQIYLQVIDDLKTEPMYTTISGISNIKPSEPHIPDKALLIPVCAALTILLIVAIIFICKCRKKCCCPSEEPIYINKTFHKSRK